MQANSDLRARTSDGEEFVGDMFGLIISVDTNINQIGGSIPWPERNGARVVEPRLLTDDVFEEAENRGVIVQVR